MELSDKNIVEKIKTIQLTNLFKKEDYIDVLVNNYYYQGIIKDIKEIDKYDIILLLHDEQMERKSNMPLSSLSIIGEKSNFQENLKRKRCLNNDIYLSDNKELITLINQEIKKFKINYNSDEISNNKNNETNEEKEIKNINYNAYDLNQFLNGAFIDILVHIQNEIQSGKKDASLNELIALSLDIFIFILEKFKSNLSKIIFFMNNIKSLIFENIYAIFASFRLIISNIEFIFIEEFYSTELISKKIDKIINEIYQIIINNSEIFIIPPKILTSLISFIILNNLTKKSIINFQKYEIYKIYIESIGNFYESKEKIIEENKKYEINFDIGLNGLDLLYNYIIKDFDIKQPSENNNIEKAIDVLVEVLNYNKEYIYKYLEKSFDNIKSDNEHKSIIQTIILIQNLFSKEIPEKNLFEKLNNKYDIFNLIINDLIRYINIIKEKNITPEENTVYEGIYPHKENIEHRLKIFFFFVKGNKTNKGLKLNSKQHLEKIYKNLNNKIFHNELVCFFSIFSKYINIISNETLEEFLNNIIENEKEFDLYSFSDTSIYIFIIKVLMELNIRENILILDSKKVTVKKDSILKLDLIFDILIKNKNDDIQIKICEFLVRLCLDLYNYKTSFCQNYWNNLINKIVNLLENEQKIKNITGMNGLIKLIDIIYSSCVNFGGKIPKNKDTCIATEPSDLYTFIFISPQEKKKSYRIKVGKNDKMLLTRVKLGYYYDIPINNVVFEDLEGKRYSFMDEQIIFQEVFPAALYCPDKDNIIPIKVLEIKDLFLKIKGNPKELMDNNKILINILINNLYSESSLCDEIKQKIWNIISKIKNETYINNIKKFGEKEKLDEEEIKRIFNIDELYIFLYNLHSIKEYINTDKNIEKEFLNNLINVHNIDEILYNILFDFDSYPDNCKLIHYEFLLNLVDIINIIEKYKDEINEDNKKLLKIKDKNEIFEKINNIILNLLKIQYDNLSKNSYFNKYDIIYEKDEDDELDYINGKIDKTISDLFNSIFELISQISYKNENIYIEYLFNNLNLFKNIFIYDYIKNQKKELKRILNENLLKNLFNKDWEKNIQIYFEIIFSAQIVNDLLINSEIDGSFFKELSSIINKYKKEYLKNNDLSQNNLDLFIKIIDIILNYIQIECENAGYIQIFDISVKTDENENILKSSKLEGILILLKSILNLSNKKLIYYLVNKIDISDLFLNKCIFRKSNKTPINTQKMICDNDKSKQAMLDLILFIIQNLPDETKNIEEKIFDIIDGKNKLGFWKNNKISNWELKQKGFAYHKYICLENVISGCYINSILQQLFMIEKFRETILNIKDAKKESLLYQLQLLFSALKTYECKFYDPTPLIHEFKMDINEIDGDYTYYNQFINIIENNIKLLYKGKNEENPYKDLFKFFFGIKTLDEFKFIDCGHKRYNEFIDNKLQLEIKDFNDLEKSLKNYSKSEIMDGNNKIICEECNLKRTCCKKKIFKSLPNILIIFLKRFEIDYNTMERIKNNSYFEFPFELNMKDYLIEDNQEINTEYELTGITINDYYDKHDYYYDIIKTSDNKWYKFYYKGVKLFDKDDIQYEAFGIPDSNKINEGASAYILIYSKKNFNNDKIENLENNFKTKLALPPYDKMSNINDDLKSILNLQMYKFWTLENILDPLYQKFILNLFRLSLVKNKNLELSLLKNSYKELYKELKEEGYLDIKDNNEKYNVINNNKIFELGIRYFFNVLLRINKTESYNLIYFIEIINISLEIDNEKCRYILEEFCNDDAINEYLVFCPNKESIKNVSKIIIKAFKSYFNDKKLNDKAFIFNYINTLLLFIYHNIYNICLENVIYLFCSLLDLDKNNIIINHLKNSGIEFWLSSLDKVLLTEEDQAIIESIMHKDNLPKIESKHFILTEKENIETAIDDNQNINIDIDNKNKLNNIKINFELMRKFYYDLNKYN